VCDGEQLIVWINMSFEKCEADNGIGLKYDGADQFCQNVDRQWDWFEEQ
jgi:hypothetical protein